MCIAFMMKNRPEYIWSILKNHHYGLSDDGTKVILNLDMNMFKVKPPKNKQFELNERASSFLLTLGNRISDMACNTNNEMISVGILPKKYIEKILSSCPSEDVAMFLNDDFLRCTHTVKIFDESSKNDEIALTIDGWTALWR